MKAQRIAIIHFELCRDSLLFDEHGEPDTADSRQCVDILCGNYLNICV
jgi:hypothetical protein